MLGASHDGEGELPIYLSPERDSLGVGCCLYPMSVERWSKIVFESEVERVSRVGRPRKRWFEGQVIENSV
jgi:hypothetical protein